MRPGRRLRSSAVNAAGTCVASSTSSPPTVTRTRGLIIGMLASVINHMLAAIDDLAVSHGEAVRGEDVLKMMAISLEPPATARLRADAS